MVYRSLFPRDLLSELGRWQQEMQRSMDASPNIRGFARSYPALNVGGTQNAVEVYAFLPGLDPQHLDIQLEKNVLSVAGECAPVDIPEDATVHIEERFSGKFRRVVSLPEDIDPDAVEANYRDGVLHISIARRKAVEPKRITINGS